MDSDNDEIPSQTRNRKDPYQRYFGDSPSDPDRSDQSDSEDPSSDEDEDPHVDRKGSRKISAQDVGFGITPEQRNATNMGRVTISQVNGGLKKSHQGDYIPDGGDNMSPTMATAAINKFLSTVKILDTVWDPVTLEEMIMKLNQINRVPGKGQNHRVLTSVFTERALRQLKEAMQDLPLRGKVEINMLKSTGRLHVNYLQGFTIYQTQRLLKILLKSLNQDTRSAAQSNDQVAEDLAKSCIQKIMTMTISHVNDVRKRAAHREWWSEKMDDHPAARSLLEGQGSSAYSKRGVQFLENPNDHVPGIPRPTANRREQTLRLLRDQITQLGGVNRSGFEKTLEDIPFPDSSNFYKRS